MPTHFQSIDSNFVACMCLYELSCCRLVDDGLVAAALDKKRNGLEATIRDVMGNELGLPPFDLEPLPLGMKELFSEDAEDIDFAAVRLQKKEVTLAMHL